ncbi:MAG: hypothetical protein AAF602_01595 [Myxococcota bacterium]
MERALRDRHPEARLLTARQLLSLTSLHGGLATLTGVDTSDVWLTVFVSHRWATRTHPDPDGAQLGALQRWIAQMCDVARALTEEDVGRRTDVVPTLNAQGVLQAAMLVLRAVARANPSDAERGRELRDLLLDRVGFWYDYVSLPQAPRTSAQHAAFVRGLLGIRGLLLAPSTTTIALRTEGDDYESRGWCVAEMLHARSRRDDQVPLVLGIQSLDARFETLDATTIALLERWSDPGHSAMNVLGDALTHWSSLAHTLRRPGHPELAMLAGPSFELGRTLLTELTAHLHLHGTDDLGALVAESQTLTRLRFGDPSDRALVGLMMVASVVDARSELGLWWEALERLATNRRTGVRPRAGGLALVR